VAHEFDLYREPYIRLRDAPGSGVMVSALGHLRVLDLSEHIAGQYCSRLLADFGAQVTLVEPPGGSVIRKQGPFREADGSSLLFFHLNFGKKSVTLEQRFGALTSMAPQADIILVPLGVDRAALRNANPLAIVALVSDFGEDGPLARWQGSEMIHQALSGVMYQNGAPEREPLYGCGHRSYYAAGVTAYCAILAAVFARAISGRGDEIKVDVAETAASMGYNLANQYNYNGTYNHRMDGARVPQATAKCNDGWIAVFIYPHRWKDTWMALGAPEMIDDPRFASIEERMRHWSEVMTILRMIVADQKADDVVERLQAVGTVVEKANTPEDLRKSPHLQARGYWQTVTADDSDRRILGAPFRMTATPWQVCSAAPEQRSNAANPHSLGTDA
jgi:crotonobetainyl-CoA:carnitine CoA-transferase CaiB-like acyl-CoA transferase